MLDVPPCRTELLKCKVGIYLLAAILLDEDWQTWLFAALAFLYGLGVLIVIIFLLVKSSKIHKR